MSLSSRQIQIARRVTCGKGNKEIAGELNISTRTVEMHLRILMGRLHTKSRVVVAVWFARNHPEDIAIKSVPAMAHN